MVLPASVLRHAAARHGVVLLEDLRLAGVQSKSISKLVAGGQLVRLHRGLYRLAGVPHTWEQRQLAGCLATHGIASHRAAARLWGIDLALPSSDDWLMGWPVEVSVARRHSCRPSGVVIHRSADLDLASVPTRDSIPVTTPQRMLVDLGAVVDTEHVARAVEQCIVARLVSVATIDNELGRVATRGRPGVATLRQVLTDWHVDDQRPDSGLEPAFARLCQRAGLPKPIFQYELRLGGRTRRIDFAYPDNRLAIEVDGFACRTDRSVFQDERWRQNDLIQTGWRVLRFTWHDVTYRPDYVAASIRALLA